MNYYNPYSIMMPYGASAITPAKTSLFSNLIGGVRGINWGSILNNTQRTLGLINQAIPVVKQVTPVMKNAKTMFKVMNEFKKVDEPVMSQNQEIQNNRNQTFKENTYSKKQTNDTPQISSVSYNEPTFFI